MSTSELKQSLKHPYFGVKLSQWIGDLYRYGIDFEQIEKYKKITEFSVKLLPYSLLEKLKYDSVIDKVQIEKEPIFVIGHWRSGTTHLQNVLTQDPQWGYLNTIQSVFPNVFLSLEHRLTSLMPEQKRPMDNVKLSASTPSEEEVALATMCKGSFWQGYFFTNDMDFYFNKYVLTEGISQSELLAWKKGYLKLLKKLSFHNEGKQLLLKNPPNTARVKLLLEMFPNAKFIHIYRNPYDVFQSRVKQYDSAVRMKDLQSLSKDDWIKKTIRYYKLMMDRYLSERDLIPEGNLVEVSYETLKADTLGTTAKIYSQLGIENYEQAKTYFEKYLSGLAGYKQNKYNQSAEDIATVNKNWKRYGEEFGYQMGTVTNVREHS